MNIDSLAIQMSKKDIEKLVKQKQWNLKRIATLRALGEKLRAEIAALNEEIISLGGQIAEGPAAGNQKTAGKKARRGRPKKAQAKSSAEKQVKKSNRKAGTKRKRAAKGGTWSERISETLATMGGEALQKELVTKWFGPGFTPGQYATIASAITKSDEIEKTKGDYGVVARFVGKTTANVISAKKKVTKSGNGKSKKSTLPLNDAAYEYLQANGGRAAFAEVRAAVLAKGQHHLALTGKLRHDSRIVSEGGEYVIVG